MFRKLTKMLFNEEEIVTDETKETPVYEVKQEIPPLKSFTGVEVTPVEKVEVVQSEPSDVQEEAVKKKSMMINIEESPTNPIVKTSKIQRKPVQYEPQEVLSPIYGSKEQPAGDKPKPTYQAESRRPRSSVISPMFGNVEAEPTPRDMQLEDLSLETMLEKEEAQEVQVCLFDFDKESSHE